MLIQKIDKEKMNLAVNTLRMLSADAVEKAQSGHPGLPMGCADIAFVLWMQFLRFAVAIAVELARQGHRVHLTTTDPAAHVTDAVGEVPARLTVGRIDPQAETGTYRAEVLSSAGAELDAQGRALLEEDLRSPCTEEIAVFRAFARAVDQGQDGFVVLDTAPTGHTILLLDATLAYHRELSRQSSGIPDSVQQLLPRLRDPGFTRVLLITLPEATPVHEAAQLQDDLVRAGIRPFAWVINQSLSPLLVTDPVLLSRQHHEGVYIREVVQQLASRTAIIPWLTETPWVPSHSWLSFAAGGMRPRFVRSKHHEIRRGLTGI